eukprot:jgi/Tetstr1/431276/TSEL_020972.t1
MLPSLGSSFQIDNEGTSSTGESDDELDAIDQIPGYCTMSTACDGTANGGVFCNKGLRQCTVSCAGTWCLGTPAPTHAAPPPATGEVEPYCSWLGCDGTVQGGVWCNSGAAACIRACGGEWCTENKSSQPTPAASVPVPSDEATPVAPLPHIFYGWYPQLAATLDQVTHPKENPNK